MNIDQWNTEATQLAVKLQHSPPWGMPQMQDVWGPVLGSAHDSGDDDVKAAVVELGNQPTPVDFYKKLMSYLPIDGSDE